MSRILRGALLVVILAPLTACGPESGVEEPPEAAPNVAPGTEPAQVPATLQSDSTDAR